MSAKVFELSGQDILDLYFLCVHYKNLRRFTGCPSCGLTDTELEVTKKMAQSYIDKVKEAYPLDENNH